MTEYLDVSERDRQHYTYTGVKLITVTVIMELFLKCILKDTCIGTIVIYELITRKSQFTTEKCI
jgi:hypothetical protein